MPCLVCLYGLVYLSLYGILTRFTRLFMPSKASRPCQHKQTRNRRFMAFCALAFWIFGEKERILLLSSAFIIACIRSRPHDIDKYAQSAQAIISLYYAQEGSLPYCSQKISIKSTHPQKLPYVVPYVSLRGRFSAESLLNRPLLAAELVS